ncbi:type VI secretion system-associated FHA domain protein TagH [Aliiruegeria lutimaris]|uniref:FHA domain protein n=1 Tax=Aliiruegeria lutimaris TaxID=571298 RepID=A0A1G8K6F5_9RHOB|nr:type VI secretion system-associated FHA domain protein TagH [Aliiruegeria lutimaris]SDI38973.1 FHA domain protein [Aliiruegeria lutimaris]
MNVVLHFQSSGSIPGDGRPVAMVGNSLTIGRGKNNDLVLPDPDRLISSNHCAIEDQNGNVVVIDLSTNGTFLNYGKIPLGKVPTPLNDGDILSIGNYELAVAISTGKETGQPALLDPVQGRSVSPRGARPDQDLEGLLDAPSMSQQKDVINELLDSPGGPVGPKGIMRPELGEDGLLPPLGEGEEDDILGKGPDPDSLLGASQGLDSSSLNDHMNLPKTASSTIPDDWDLDLPVSPLGRDAPADNKNPFAEDPFAESSIPGSAPSGVGSGAAFIPEDLDLGIGAPGGGTPAKTTPAPETAAEKPAPLASEPAPPVAPPAEPVIAPSPAQATPPAPAAAPAAPQPGTQDAELLKILLDAAGVGEVDLSDEEAPVVTAERLGNVLRIVIHGLREILMTRSSIKSEFRIDQTRISPSGNNALKFSVTPEEAVEALVGPPRRGYLAAELAADQALQDIKAHEVATMTGMEAALKGVLRRLSPEALESEITSAGGIGSLLKGRKARYWETYERIYADVADAAENDFHELFSREFARAYQEQLNKLKGGS